jgi:hypothetical protein
VYDEWNCGRPLSQVQANTIQAVANCAMSSARFVGDAFREHGTEHGTVDKSVRLT